MDWPIIFRMLLLFGALQGAVMGGMLWRTEEPQRRANRFLAILLFFLSYRLLVIGIGVSYTSWTYHVFLEYNWLYGALLYFYVRAYVETEWRWQGQNWLHFIPVAIEFVFANFVKIQNFYWDGSRESLMPLGAEAYVLWMHTPFQLIIFAGVILFYTYQGWQLISKEGAEETGQLLPASLQWIRLILLAYFAFGILVILVGLVDYLFFNYAFNPFYTYPTYLTLAVLTYWLALQGFARRNEPIHERLRTLKEDKREELAQYLPDLARVMREQKLYTEPTLTLASLAEAIQIKPYQLTQILNRLLKQSFNDYVNAFRVEEAMRMIQSSDYDHYTLLSIAYESGFNSKATFNRIVKKMTGKSPNQIKQERG